MSSSGIAGSIGSSYVAPTGTAGTDYPISYTSESSFSTSIWTIAEILKTEYNDKTRTFPKIGYDFTYLNNNKIIWITTPLRTMHCETVMYNGWYVMLTVQADKKDLTNDNIASEWSNRTNNAYVAYWYCQDGLNWQYGGQILETAAEINPLSWSGSLVMREGSQNTIDLFYTSAVAGGSYMELAVSSGTIATTSSGVTLSGFNSSTVMMVPDGTIYATQEQNASFIMKSPFPFINPGDGKVYCIFESLLAGVEGSFVITDAERGYLPPGEIVGSDAADGTACIGLAVLADGAYASGNFAGSEWTLLDPLISGLGVTEEMSVPHMIFDGSETYLLTSIKTGSFTGSIYSPNGLYGFHSSLGLFGPYSPLNSSGLVLSNPTSAPQESTTFYIDNNFSTYSVVEILPQDGSQDPNSPTTYRIGGTPAPTYIVAFSHGDTFLTKVQNYGQMKTTRDWTTIWTQTQGNSAPWVLDA